MRIDVLRVSMWLVGSVAVVGNLLAILIRLIFSGSPSANSRLTVSLAVSDFFMGFYMYIIASADSYYRGTYILYDESWRNGWLCHLAGFLASLSSEVSMFMLLIMSLDRFVAVVFPLSRMKLTPSRALFGIAISWLAGVVLAAIPLLPIDYFGGGFYSRSGVCLSLHLTSEKRPGWEYSVAVFIGMNFVGFMIIACCYAWMYRAMSRSLQTARRQTKCQKKEVAVARKMMLIVLTDFCAWMPIIVLGMLAVSGQVTIPSDVYAWIAVFVLPINSAINPILYTIAGLRSIRTFD
ncbi:G-protein coupled receptor GRL101-like [Tubulanus polymorphus]|uniref:G-protein coupled receptor GRL101-like n=1 Tax=Tubulanus polymorphus TaxID=672921 RepID=UPI003DA65E32